MLAVGMLFWPTIAELIHRTRHVHHNMSTIRPTAKTGLFGGAAFMALNASLFWLICVILADNARDDYFDEEDQNHKCEYGQVFTTDYDAKGQGDVWEMFPGNDNKKAIHTRAHTLGIEWLSVAGL